MKPYEKIDVSESHLEEMVRRHPDLIEDGLRFVDHQVVTDRGRLDVLLVGPKGNLSVVELKVAEDDSMLLQGLEYYDWAQRNLERIASTYTKHGIDPTRDVYLELIAPAFSNRLITGCRWVDIPIGLFTFTCIRVAGADEVVPVYTQLEIGDPPKPIEIHTLDERFEYIHDEDARNRAHDFVLEIEGWAADRVTAEPTKNYISIKVDGKVLTYLSPRRSFFWVSTNDAEGEWRGWTIRDDTDLEAARSLVRANFDALS